MNASVSGVNANLGELPHVLVDSSEKVMVFGQRNNLEFNHKLWIFNELEGQSLFIRIDIVN